MTALPPPCDESARFGDEAVACPDERGTLVATVLGSSLAFVVGSIVNVALPSMQRSLDTDAAGAQWIVNAYLLPLGALVLIGGALGDHYGRKRLFQIGLGVFTLGCLGCALAPTLPALLVTRAVQGAGAALLAPNSLAIIAASFSGEKRGKAIGTWAAAGAIAGAVAPVLGGWIVDAASWRWAFVLVVPPALAAFLVARRSVAESRESAAEAASRSRSILATSSGSAGRVAGSGPSSRWTLAASASDSDPASAPETSPARPVQISSARNGSNGATTRATVVNTE